MFRSAPSKASPAVPYSTTWRDLTVPDVLEGKFGIKLIQPKNKDFATFIAIHCSELLDYAFSDPTISFSTRAFLLLSNRSKIIAAALLQNDRLFVKATDVLGNREASPCLVSRLATLFGIVLAKGDSRLTDSVGFVLPLLRFIADPNVSGLFVDLCTASPRLMAIHAVLAQTRFSLLVLNEFRGEPTCDKIANLCSIVHICLKNPILHPSFANEATHSVLSKFLDSSNGEVQNQAWQALSCACNEVTVSKMFDLKERALAVLSKIDRLTVVHVSAVDLLAGIVKYAPGWIDEAQRKEFIQTLLGLIRDFPNATNLMSAVFRCLRNATKSAKFLALVLMMVFPALIATANATERTSASAQAMEFLAAAWEFRRDNKVVKQFLTTNQTFCKFFQQKIAIFLNQKAEDAKPVAIQTVRRKIINDVD
jgi:hypothetical protein